MFGLETVSRPIWQVLVLVLVSWAKVLVLVLVLRAEVLVLERLGLEYFETIYSFIRISQ